MPAPSVRRRDITEEMFRSAVEQAKQEHPNGWRRRAATILGVTPGAIAARLMTRPDISTEVFPHPKGHLVAGVSTLYNGDGKIVNQWVKSKSGERTPEEWAEHVRAAFVDVAPIKPIPRPKAGNDRLLTVYPIGDHHVAMYAWGEETGADYDIKIAERLLVSAAQHLVHCAPDSDTALIVNLGDFLHVDNIKNETSRSGHTLDVDTRYQAMIHAGVKMLRAVIETALGKHRHVKVVNVIGNHDDVGAQWLALALAMMYERNPRVTIETKPGKFHYHRHGKVLIGLTHGDTGKPEKIHGVMAADVPELWGATQHRYWFTGHVHTRRVQEFPGVMWETFRTLAPGDAWSRAAAYRSGRDMTAIVFDAAHGEMARHRFDVGMLK